MKNLEKKKLKRFQLSDEGKSEKEREFLPFYTRALFFEIWNEMTWMWQFPPEAARVFTNAQWFPIKCSDTFNDPARLSKQIKYIWKDI